MLGRRYGNIFSRDRKSLYMILSIVLVFVCSLTIVYAALNTVLKITGNAEVVASSWDIHLDNVNVSIGSVNGTEPSINSPTTATFSTKLTNPGDFYEFSIDVVNDGTIDAMIDSISKTPTLTEQQAKYLNYIVEYQNGETISNKQLVQANSFVRLKVRVEFRKDLTASDLPTQTETLNLSFTVNYVQSDDTSSSVLNNGTLKAMVKSGAGTNVGDEICIGKECFYVISSDEDNVTMLAKYNLLVGNKYDDVNGAVPLENPTGIQDEIAKGWFDGYSEENHSFIGIKPFASTNYWSNINDYPAYVYNENSYLYEYVESYKSYLNELGATINEARLITIEELESLGCSRIDVGCAGAPSWVYATTYWSGEASSSTNIWTIYSTMHFGRYSYTDNSARGVRPVITIPKNEIIGIVKPIANGSLDEVGTIVTIGSEQFYTIGTEGDNVKLLAKYNLYVGGEYENNNWIAYGKDATGMQDQDMLGYVPGKDIVKGTTVFSSDSQKGSNYSNYSGSIVEGYVNNYKTKLEEYFGLDILEARLIFKNELTDQDTFACDDVSYSCLNSPYSWIYATSYWSGSASDVDYVWFVEKSGYFCGSFVKKNDFLGVRPVIVISKSEF